MEDTLGKRIAANRRRLGLTQEQLAEKLGVTPQAVSKWENDLSCPDIATLPKLAEIFGISIDQLMGRETEEVYYGEVVEKKNPAVSRVKTVIQDSRKAGAIAGAVLLLLVGGMLLLSQVFHWELTFWGVLWPSAMIVIGGRFLCRRFSVFSLALLLFGGYFLIDDILDPTFLNRQLVLPLVIVLLGLGLLADAFRRPRRNKKVHASVSGSEEDSMTANYTQKDGYFSSELSFGEDTHRVQMPRLEGGHASCSFGELTVTLDGCGEIADGCRIEASCSFGELILQVPRRCRIRPAVKSAFASVETVGQPDSEAGCEILLEGKVSFGQIEIRYI